MVPGPDGGEVVLGGGSRLDMAAIGAELFGLAHGDAPDVFAPAPSTPRKQGERALRRRLAHARFRALELDELWRWENARRPEDEREPEAAWRKRIAAAFKVNNWHTIRQWEDPCREALGVGLAELLLLSVRVYGILEGGGGLTAAERTPIDGEAYDALAKRSKALGATGSR